MVTSLAASTVLLLCAPVIGLAPSDAFWLATASYALVGICLAMHSSANRAVQQMAVAPEMRGRCFATSRSIFQAVSPLSLAIAAPIAEVYGVRPFWLVWGLSILALAVMRRFTRDIYYIEDSISPELAAETPRAAATRTPRA